jgi:hypothetical protein
MAERLGAPAELAPALARARVAGAALFALPTRYDPGESIPAYSERPDEIRVNFTRMLAASARNVAPTGR